MNIERLFRAFGKAYKNTAQVEAHRKGPRKHAQAVLAPFCTHVNKRTSGLRRHFEPQSQPRLRDDRCQRSFLHRGFQKLREEGSGATQGQPDLRLVGTRRESHGTAYRQRDRYHKLYAHRRITGEWFSLSSKELVELMDGFDTRSISSAIGQEMAKLKPSMKKRDRNGLERAFRDRFDDAYPAMLRLHLERLPDKG